MGKVEDDPRIDPRIRAFAAFIPSVPQGDVTSRDELLAEVNTPEALAEAEQAKALLDILDDETVAPSKGLDISTVEFTSTPDGNTVKIQLIRPQSEVPLPCVYYIHGGGMQALSCFDGLYRAWGRIIAAQGVAVGDGRLPQLRVAVVGARGRAVPGRAQRLRERREVGRRPRRRARDRRGTHRGGGRERWRKPDPGHWDEAQGRRRPRESSEACTRCAPTSRDPGPRIASRRRPRTTGSSSICTTTGARWRTASRRSRRATRWRGRRSPARTTSTGLVPTMISVNECDPLRDEGIEFYRLLLRAGVPARCRQVMGTMHGSEVMAIASPDISRETAARIAHFCRCRRV